MVAPVVLITVSVIFANGLETLSTYYAEKVLSLDEKRLGILSGPHGELLNADSVPPVDRERLAQIRDLEPLMIERHRRVRITILIMWMAVALFVLSVAAIAVARNASRSQRWRWSLPVWPCCSLASRRRSARPGQLP
jgi:hypothetical protein